MTPEGKVKEQIKKLLSKYECWWYMPVPGGYGAATLDFICATKLGRAFFIEAKALGKTPTPRQKATIRDLQNRNLEVFVLDGDEKIMEKFENWLIWQKEIHEHEGI